MPLHFNTATEATNWLNETGHYGLVKSVNQNGAWDKFMIVRFDNGKVWAFESPTKLVSLPQW